MTMRSLILTVLLALTCALQFVPGVGTGDARADNHSNGPTAYDHAAAVIASTKASTCTYWGGGFAASRVRYLEARSGSMSAYYSEIQCGTNSTWRAPYPPTGNDQEHLFPRTNGGCAAGTTWQPDSHTCYSAQACLAKPSIPLGTLNISVAGVKFCNAGCEFEAKNGTQSALTTGGGETLSVYTGGAYTPTGSACSAGQGDPPPDQPQQCVTDSSSTWPVCIKKTGEHCVKSKSGRQLCWKPFETGEKTDQDVLQVRNAGTGVSTPSTPPPPGESFTPGASVSETTTTTASDGTSRTVTTTTTNYTTAGGTNASGSGDGSGEVGDGTGTGSDGDSDYGSAGDGVGNIYTKKTDTLDSSFSDFTSQVQSAPIVAAITGFFTFNETAVCPIWTVPENAWVPEMTFDWFCTGVVADLLPLMGILCLAAAAWLGFKIGVVW